MAEDSFQNKIIMVTGGTGSFGHTIVKKLLDKNPKEIRIFSRDEKKQDDMRYEFEGNKKLRFVIGDVRDKDSLRRAMRNVDIIYHAAALKQVPHCEENVFQAVLTNVVGAQNVVDVALEYNVYKVIAISTDKAVEPVNVMGMTKAIQERIMISANLHKDGKRTKFSCVRYGNVLATRGSVIPLFLKQIKADRQLTITDKRMTRFILTLEEAIELVFKATEIMVGGEIFTLELPAHTVLDLAEVMLSEFNAKNKEIKVIGIRPGEKIHETLVSPTESLRTVKKKNLFIILPQIKIAQIEQKYPHYQNENIFRFSSDTARRLSKTELKELLEKNEQLLKDNEPI